MLLSGLFPTTLLFLAGPYTADARISIFFCNFIRDCRVVQLLSDRATNNELKKNRQKRNRKMRFYHLNRPELPQFHASKFPNKGMQTTVELVGFRMRNEFNMAAHRASFGPSAEEEEELHQIITFAHLYSTVFFALCSMLEYNRASAYLFVHSI